MNRSVFGRSAALCALALTMVSFGAAQAQERIGSGDRKIARIGLPGATKTFCFAVAAGQGVVIQGIRVSTAGNVAPELLVYAPGGELLADEGHSTSNQARVRLSSLPVGGLYTLLVKDCEATHVGDVSVLLNLLPGAGSEGEITSGEVRTASIAYDTRSFTFHAEAGQGVAIHGIRVPTSGDVAPELLVYAPGGELLADEGYSTSNQARVRLPNLPVGGSYTLLVKDWDTTGVGDVKVSLNVLPGAGSEGQVASGEVRTASIAYDARSFTFEAEAGQGVVIHGVRVPTSGDVAPELLVYGPGGELLADEGHWSSNQVRVRLSSLALSGSYTLLVKDCEATHVGDVRVSLNVLPGAGSEGEITSGEVRTASIAYDARSFTFHAEAGQGVVIQGIQVPTFGDVAPELLVYGPGGELLADEGHWSSNQVRVRLSSLALSGSYTLLVKDCEATHVGDVRVSLNLLPGGASEGQIMSGEARIASVTYDARSFTFQAEAGQGVAIQGIQVPTSGEVAPQLLVYAPGGELLADEGHWSSNQASVQLSGLPSTGSYTLVVKDCDAVHTGDVDVSLSLLPPSTWSITNTAPDAGAIVSQTSVTLRWETSGAQFDTFDVYLGDQYPLPRIAQGVGESCYTVSPARSRFYTWYVVGYSGGVPHPGPFGWFGLAADAESVGQAKRLPNGVPVSLSGLVVSRVFAGESYVQQADRSAGMRLICEDRLLQEPLEAGATLDVTGVMSVGRNQERSIEAYSVEPTGASACRPLGLRGSWLGGADWFVAPRVGQPGVVGAAGLNNIGLLVQTWGEVTYAGTDSFYINDGSGLDDGSGHLGVLVTAPGLAVPPCGGRVSVTGISSCVQDHDGLQRCVCVARQEDIHPQN